MRSRILTCVLLLALAGCESKRLLAGLPLHTFLYDIHVGMTRAEVIRQLGELAQCYTTRWSSCSTSRTGSTPRSSPIAIVDGTVVALGKTYYEDFLKSRCRLKATAERQG